MAKSNARRQNARDDKIIDLLNTLGDRMISGENERRSLVDAVSSLEDKSMLNEKAYISLQSKLFKQQAQEESLSTRQDSLEKKLDAQMEKIEKAASLADKMEAVLKQQSRLNRRLDAVSQERGRMLRKLEKIEDNIIETQETLNTKAMVLMADEKTANDSRKPVLAAKGNGATARKKDGEGSLFSLFDSARIQAGIMAVIVLLAVGAGYSVSRWQAPSGAAMLSLAEESRPEPAQSTETAANNTSVPELSDANPPSIFNSGKTPPNTAVNTESMDPFTAGLGDEDGNAAGPVEEAGDKTIDEIEGERIAKFESDPDALAADLNGIAPVAGDAKRPAQPEQTAIQKPESAAPGDSPANTEPAALIKPKPSDFNEAAFIKSQAGETSLQDRIEPDPGLPRILKEIEGKAFEGMAEAQHDLAAIYIAGHGGIGVNHERGAKWFREAAIQGIANARYNLGVLYHQGLGVPQDTDIAINWYRAAAMKGHPEAQYNLGIAHIEGIGVQYDPEQAAYYFQNAAGKGIVEAAYNLGLIQENGLLGQPRPEEALYWYQAAVNMGSPEAQTALDQLSDRLGYTEEEIGRIYNELSILEKTQTKKQSEESTPKNAPSASSPDSAKTETVPVLPLTAGDQDLPEQSNIGKSQNDLVLEIQKHLVDLGLLPDPANGQNNQRTEDAIRSYQSMYALKEDGKPSEALLVHMITTGLDDQGTGEVGSRAE